MSPVAIRGFGVVMRPGACRARTQHLPANRAGCRAAGPDGYVLLMLQLTALAIQVAHTMGMTGRLPPVPGFAAPSICSA